MKKIAIVGCGISGLYFANLLQNNQNYEYVIFEKKREFYRPEKIKFSETPKIRSGKSEM